MVSMNIKSEGAQVSTVGMACPTVYLSSEQSEALGITEAPKAGTVYMLRVRAVASRVTAEMEDPSEPEAAGEKEAPDANEADVSLTLMLTDMEVLQGDSKDTATSLYGSPSA